MSVCIQCRSLFLTAMKRTAYCFALHKWRRHVFLKDKMPDERENSFHFFYFAAVLLSDLWLNLKPKKRKIRNGRGFINHTEFSIYKRRGWVADAFWLAGLPRRYACGLFHYSDLQITRAALSRRLVKLRGRKWEPTVKDPFHLCCDGKAAVRVLSM